MPNTTCRLLSNGYKFQINQHNQLNLMPCCKWLGPKLLIGSDIDAQQYRAYLDSVDAGTDAHCRDCRYQEQNSLRNSWRQLSFKLVPESAQVGDASYLELQLDTICNGGCIMCGPWHSTYWQQELGHSIMRVSKASKTDHVRQILDHVDMAHVRKILFLGGEPFLTDTDSRMLPHVPDPGLVTLQYTTNGSIMPDQLRQDQWSRFGSVLINFSIDGVGDRFNYVRYPLQWSQVQNNLLRMRDSMPESVQFQINHTVNLLNLYYYDEFEQWYQNNFAHDRFGRAIGFHFNPAGGLLSPQTVPAKLLDRLGSKYAPDSKVMHSVTNTGAKTNVLEFLQTLDQRRGLDWHNVFPEISDCLC